MPLPAPQNDAVVDNAIGIDIPFEFTGFASATVRGSCMADYYYSHRTRKNVRTQMRVLRTNVIYALCLINTKRPYRAFCVSLDASIPIESTRRVLFE